MCCLVCRNPIVALASVVCFLANLSASTHFFEGGYFLLQINALILWSETVSAFDSSFLLRRISANDLGAAALVAHSAQSDLVVLRFKTLFLSADPCRQK